MVYNILLIFLNNLSYLQVYDTEYNDKYYIEKLIKEDLISRGETFENNF